MQTRKDRMNRNPEVAVVIKIRQEEGYDTVTLLQGAHTSQGPLEPSEFAAAIADCCRAAEREAQIQCERLVEKLERESITGGITPLDLESLNVPQVELND